MLFRSFCGEWNCCYIALLENYPTDSKLDLHKREGNLIKQFKEDTNLDVLNILIAGRDKKQYYLDNKERIDEINRLYGEKNKEKARERSKKHYEANKEILQKRHREYNIANKEKLKEYQQQYYLQKKLPSIKKI